MSGKSSVEAVLSRASELERVYDWIGSVELYRTALGMVSAQDVSKAGEIHERAGYGFFRAGLQADSVDEFVKRMGCRRSLMGKPRRCLLRLRLPELCIAGRWLSTLTIGLLKTLLRKNGRLMIAGGC